MDNPWKITLIEFDYCNKYYVLVEIQTLSFLSDSNDFPIHDSSKKTLTDW